MAAEDTSPIPTLDFEAMAADHALWLTSEGKEGKRANLRGMDLSEMDLSGKQLAEASMRGVILRGSNLSGADLRTADLSEVVLDDANLTGALLTGASLARAKLHNANFFGADMVTANLSSVIADGANFSETKLIGATLRDANFRHVDFSRAQLREANLRGATLLEANLTSVDLTGADCRDVNFDRAIFTDAILKGTNLRGTKFGEVDLNTADFSVALDLSAEAQSQSLQSERNKLQEEQAMLATRRMEMDEQEKLALTRNQTVRGVIDDLAANHEETIAAIKKHSRGYVGLFIAWLAIAALIVFVMVQRVSEMGVERVAMVLVVTGLMVLLSLAAIVRNLSVARRLKKLVVHYNELSQLLVVAHEDEPRVSAAVTVPASVPSEPLLVKSPPRSTSDEEWGKDDSDL